MQWNTPRQFVVSRTGKKGHSGHVCVAHQIEFEGILGDKSKSARNQSTQAGIHLNANIVRLVRHSPAIVSR